MIWEIIERLQLGKENFLSLSLFLEKTYRMMAIDLSKREALDADLKTIQQISVIRNVHWAGKTAMFFTIEEAEEIKLDFQRKF